MEHARLHQETSNHSTSRPFFFRTPDIRSTATFFSDYRSGAVQRQAESSLPEEEQTLQQRPLETTVQRMCAECEKELKEKSTLQPKLSVGEANDPYEQEADRVADQVVDHMQASKKAPSIQTRLESAPPHITPLVMRQGEGPVAASSPVEQGIQNTRGAGETLAQPVRDSMEQAMGADFSGVRIHANSEADSLNRSLNARAFTTGKDIYFKSGEYQPESPTGRKLLAHELTHVVQQGGAAIDGDAPLSLDNPASRIQRAVSKGCVAPSFVLTPVVASLFGTVAEGLIEADYIAQKGGIPFGDVFLDNPLGPMAYVAFLAAHHPHLNRALLAVQIGLSGGVLVPDILDARDHQLYEIKPDSVDGRAAGRAKLSAIDAFMSFNSLPYVRGTTYTPTSSIPIPLGSAALAPFLGLPILLSCGIPNVSLSATRSAPGLLLYEICVEADFDCWLRVLTLELMIALIILAILASRGLPVPASSPVPAIAGGQGTGAPLGVEAAPGSAIAQANQGVGSSVPLAGEGATA